MFHFSKLFNTFLKLLLKLHFLCKAVGNELKWSSSSLLLHCPPNPQMCVFIHFLLTHCHSVTIIFGEGYYLYLILKRLDFEKTDFK